MNYLFIEKDESRSRHLEGVLADLKVQLPPRCNCSVINSTFDETLTGVLNDIEEQRARLAPAFVMIDPFGVSETPMNVISRILDNRKSEVYISFMYESINRFKGHPNFEEHLDQLFGCVEWRQGLDLDDGDEGKAFLYDLYAGQLKKSGAQYVVHFELYQGQRLIYAIFFGTKNLDGCDKMKQAIWSVDPLGEFRFRGKQIGQLTLGDAVVDFIPLQKDLQDRFKSRGWQKIETVTDFVKSDATPFHSGHLKVKTLKPMEADGKIEVKPGTRKRAGTYPNGTELRFL